MFAFASRFLPALQFGLKTIKYFVDSTFRDKVRPIPGSVVYCELLLAFEHSGIHVGEGYISNIEVDGLADSVVRLSKAADFTTKSALGRKIYVSCDRNGPVGKPVVARGARAHVGERSFYGLVIKNCHAFSTKCVEYAGRGDSDDSVFDALRTIVSDLTFHATIAPLKKAARAKLGATKWRLWDWQNDNDENEGDGDGGEDEEPTEEPDWEAINRHFCQQPLNADIAKQIRQELAATKEYEAEIADETIPDAVRQRLGAFRQTLDAITQKYEEVKGFLAACPNASFSYADLQSCPEDFAALAAALQNNAHIKELARKMGRDYISEALKKRSRIPQASRSEVHGTHRSNDVMRMLPSELLNLEDDTLETLFYAKLLENNLLTYELRGVTLADGETTETRQKRTGPVVACLDTSGSMQGAPMLKAKALLLAISNILKQENRSLHVLLFGSVGEIRAFASDRENNAVGLLQFLQQGFNGGTDFESPLRRAMEIIGQQPNYLKADVLMISDGDCSVSPAFAETLKAQKATQECLIYSVLCAGTRSADNFSDEVVVL